LPSPRIGVLALDLVILALLGLPAHAQSPAGAPVRVNPAHDAQQILNGLAITADGRISVLWEVHSIVGPVRPAGLRLREYFPDGTVTNPLNVFDIHFDDCCLDAHLAGNESGNLVAAFVSTGDQGFPVRRYGFSSGPGALWVPGPRGGEEAPNGIVVGPAGGFIMSWTSTQEPSPPLTFNAGIFLRRYDPTGHPLGPEIHVNTFRRGDQAFPEIAMARDTKVFTVVWKSKEEDGSGWGVYGQRFSAKGEKLGTEFLISTTTDGDQEEPVIAMDPRGGFVITWRSTDPEDSTRTAVFAQRFAPGGERIGGEIRVSEGTEGFEDGPAIAMDRQGNFVIGWDHWPVGLAYAKLYRADGTPVRPAIQLTSVIGQVVPHLAFAANGTFGAGWTDALREDDIADVYIQRYSASPGSEFCLFQAGEFLCDTGRTGGAPEVRYPFGGEAGEVGLLGDLDGDGRADPCVYRDGVFRCDTGHDFGAAETRVRFGQKGDVPLLGDVNGDGKVDPCVYRAGRFLCDTRHEPGTADLEVPVGGQPGDVPLIGDLDGDGKADFCLFRKGSFLCDTARDGSVHLTIQFGRPGDLPLLGDFDGDGRADPCVYRTGQLLCDTAHNGTVGGTLTFGDGKGVPLLGNVDGL
jgi:hypothetical protein